MNYILVNQQTGELFKTIVNDFAERGCKTTLIAGWVEKEGAPLNPNVKVIKKIPYNRSTTISRITTWFIFSIQLIISILIIKSKKSLVFYVSNPPFAPILAPILGKPYALLIYDLYPEVLVGKRIFNTSSFWVKSWAKMNKVAFKKAEIVFTLSDSMRESLKKYFDNEVTWEKKTRVVPVWANSDHISPVEKGENPFIKEHNLLNKFLVLYSGNMGDTHPLEVLIDAAANLEYDSDIVFYFIGEGAKRKKLEELAVLKHLKNVYFLDFLPFNQLKNSLSAADLNVVALDSEASQMSVPSKTFNTLAVGGALLGIVSPHSEVGRIITQYDVGKVFESADANGITTFIKELKADNESLVMYQKRALLAASNFTPSNAELFFNILISMEDGRYGFLESNQH